MKRFTLFFALIVSVAPSAQTVAIEAATAVPATQIEQRSDGLVYVQNSDTPFTGTVEGFHPSGEIKFERNYVDGQLNGVETLWYANGKKKAEGNIVNGKPEGYGILWYANGQKEAELHLVNGQFHGVITGWHENGQKEYERHYEHGQRVGLETVWYENGQKKLERMYGKAGYDGVVIEWYDNGQKKFQANYIDGKQQGDSSSWYSDGRKRPWVVPDSAERNLDYATTTEERPATNKVGFATVIRPTPYFERGRLMGYRVYPGTDRKQFAALGLRPGDVITAIDGVALVDPQQAIQEFGKLGDARTSLPVTIERDGLPKELVLRLRENHDNDQ